MFLCPLSTSMSVFLPCTWSLLFLRYSLHQQLFKISLGLSPALIFLSLMPTCPLTIEFSTANVPLYIWLFKQATFPLSWVIPAFTYLGKSYTFGRQTHLEESAQIYCFQTGVSELLLYVLVTPCVCSFHCLPCFLLSKSLMRQRAIFISGINWSSLLNWTSLSALPDTAVGHTYICYTFTYSSFCPQICSLGLKYPLSLYFLHLAIPVRQLKPLSLLEILMVPFSHPSLIKVPLSQALFALWKP